MCIMGRILLVLAVCGFTFTIDADAKPLCMGSGFAILTI